MPYDKMLTPMTDYDTFKVKDLLKGVLKGLQIATVSYY